MQGQSNFQPVPADGAQRRRQAFLAARRAEATAALFLRLKGYRILGRRYCIKGGEIDLIARKFDAIVFVEVKVRPTLAEAVMAIDTRKRQRMSRAASVCRGMELPQWLWISGKLTPSTGMGTRID
jgi:Holliday junction resolvase-like predicted endonuclease